MKTLPWRNCAAISALAALNILTAASSVQAAPRPATPGEAPRLILVLVVDGLPNEQVLRYRQQYQGGLKRLLTQGAWYGDAHQAHGITFTAVGHAAVLSGAYPYQHGIISNAWIDPKSLVEVYCTEDKRYKYLGNEQTEAADGTSPANLKVDTLGDQLRYATGNQSKVIAISGKDRGAILLAGKSGTAYMYMDQTGNFASSSYYMKEHPQWVQKWQAGKPQDKYFDKAWCLAQEPGVYAQDVKDGALQTVAECKHKAMPERFNGGADKPGEKYYTQLKSGPYVDQLTLDFAKAALEAENLGKGRDGAPDLLAISLSSHDYVNHAFGPESLKSHDHLLHLDKMLGEFFVWLDKQVGMDNTLVVLTADHGFPNTPQFARESRLDANNLNPKTMMEAVNKHLQEKFGVEKLLATGSAPNFHLNHKLIEQRNLAYRDVEQAAGSFLMNYEGVARVYTRSQLESGNLPQSRQSRLIQRAWHPQVSGDLMVVLKPHWIFAARTHGTTHGSPYAYDTNVPLLWMGKNWIKPGAYGHYAEVTDIAPTLAHLLRLRPPAASEGRVLTEMLQGEGRR